MAEHPDDSPPAGSGEAGAGLSLPPVPLVVLLVVALVPLVFLPGGADAFEPHKVAVLASGAALLLAIVLVRALGRLEAAGFASLFTLPRRSLAALRADPLAAAVLLFVLSSALSTVLSPRPMLSLFGVSSRPAGLVTACATAGLFFGARAAASREEFVSRLFAAASVAGIAAALYALLQAAHLDPIAWQGAALSHGIPRVPGTLGHPNNLGAFLAMTLPLTAHLALREPRGLRRSPWALGTIASAAALALTLSRGAWLACAAAGLAWVLLERPGSRAGRSASAGRTTMLLAGLAALALALLVLLTPAGPRIVARAREAADPRAPTTRTRLLMWRAAAAMLAERPLTGVGTDAFGLAYPAHRSPAHWAIEWNPGPVKAHSEPLQIAATQGCFGLGAALLVAAFALLALVRLARHADAGVRAGGATAGASLVAFAVSGLTGFTVAATGALAAALAGWMSGRALPPPASAPRASAPATALALLATLLLWAALVLAPWRGVVAASVGIELPPADPRRAAALERALAIASWDTRYRVELARTQLHRALATDDGREARALLASARAQLERVCRGFATGEERALLAHVLARQASLDPEPAALERARRALEAALAADSTSASVLELVAEGFQAIDRAGESRKPLLRCATLYPDFALPVAELGLLALADGRSADAADTLALALGRNWHDAPQLADVAKSALAEARARAAAEAASR